jgi:hypothetical protein
LKIITQPKPGYAFLLALFSCSLLMHVGSGMWNYPKTVVFLLIVVALQFINFRLWPLTFVALFAQVIIMGRSFPRLANHSNVEVLVSLFFLGLLFLRWAFKVTPKPQMVNQIFRLALISIYFITGFHKLNSGFFTIDGSCSTYVGGAFNEFVYGKGFVFPNGVIRFFQIATIIMETIIPFGLLFKKTRIPTVIILGCFHFYLSICGFANFSSFAGFLLTGSLLNLEATALDSRLVRGMRYYMVFAVISVLTSFVLNAIEGFDKRLAISFTGCIFNIAWVIYLIHLIKYNRPDTKKYVFSWWHPAVVMAISAWGLQCYVGLSNASTLTMFSNVITEKEHCNHYLINTKYTKIWNFEEDYVHIISIPDKCTWQYRNPLKGYGLPVIEFKKKVASWSKFNEPLPCVLEYKGKTLFIPDLRTSKFNNADRKLWERFLFYRRLNFTSNECMW